MVVLKESAATPVVKQSPRVTTPEHEIRDDAPAKDQGTARSKQPPRTTAREQKLRDTAPARKRNVAKIQALLADNGIKLKNVKHIYADVLVGFAGKLSPAQVAALKRHPDVENVYQDYKSSIQFFTPNPAVGNRAYYVGCNVRAANGPSYSGSSKNTWIWVVDTGIDVYHRDLNVIWFAPFPVSKVGGESYIVWHGHLSLF